MNTRALTSAAVTGVLRPFLQDINMVSAPVVARERGIIVEEVKRESAARDYESFIRIVVDAEDMPRHAGGTVFQDGKPRVVEIRDIAVDARVRAAHALCAQRRQAGLHRPLRHAARRGRRQHRHLRARPRQAGRRRHLLRRPSTSRSPTSSCARSRRSRRSSAPARCGSKEVLRWHPPRRNASS